MIAAAANGATPTGRKTRMSRSHDQPRPPDPAYARPVRLRALRIAPRTGRVAGTAGRDGKTAQRRNVHRPGTGAVFGPLGRDARREKGGRTRYVHRFEHALDGDGPAGGRANLGV